MPDITFLTFNYGNAGRYPNGPGICLLNFVKDLRKLGVKVEVFTKLQSYDPTAKSLDNTKEVLSAIKSSKVVQHWSGIFPQFINYLNSTKGPKIFLGPNVMDGVEIQKEREYLRLTKFDKIFVVNKRIKQELCNNYNIPQDKVEILMIGPDRDLWSPSGIDNGKILWKGNCTHKIKDVDFALQVAKMLPNYEFEFIGYPNPYNYLEHVNRAKACHLYFSTSISETMGMAVCESWASGLPAVIHPKIEILGENYKTGITTEKTIEAYTKAIQEIMDDKSLYEQMKLGSIDFIDKTFSSVAKDYIKDNLS